MTARRMELTVLDRIAVAVAAGAAGTLLLELAWPHALEPPPNTTQSPAEIQQPTNDVVPVGPLSDYLSIRERPLFTYDRRPFVFVVEAAPVQVGPRAEFELTAVIVTSDTRLALLRSNLTPTARRVELNQTIDGWTLAEVTPDSVVLRQNEISVTVPLRPDLGAARSGHASRIDLAASGN
jgi:hypothetical protein